MRILLDLKPGLHPEPSLHLEPEAIVSRVERVLTALELGPEAELSLVICGDQEIAELNRQYLGRRGPTNVIAFPQQEGELAGLTPGLLGDVVVSAETAAREAGENGLDPEEHLVRLLIHGVLHLLGHDHVHDEKEARAMEELTERLLVESAGPIKEEA